MPSHSKRQQAFFDKVSQFQKGLLPSEETSAAVKRVAKSISPKDAEDFAKSVVELRTKKAVLSILKDIVEPMYLNLEEAEETKVNPIAKEFHVKEDFDQYIRRYIGQPLSPKEMEAISTFKEVKPTRVERTEIWYENTDEFKNSTTTVVKKMKDGNQFSFNAFQKHSSAQPKPEEEPMGGPETPTGPETPSPEETEPTIEEEKDDILVSKSPLFKDEIEGGSILVEFLKKLDL